jgi:hypothetical protein
MGKENKFTDISDINQESVYIDIFSLLSFLRERKDAYEIKMLSMSVCTRF